MIRMSPPGGPSSPPAPAPGNSPILAALFGRGALGLGELLDASFRLLRSRFGAFVLLSGLFACITVGLEYVGVLTGTDAILNIIGRLVGLWQTTSVLSFVFAVIGGSALSVGASMGAGARTFGRMFGMNLLQGLAAGLAAIPGGLLFLLAAGSTSPILLVLAVVAVVLPAIYLATRWSVAGQALIGERCGISEALGRSWDLTAGYLWRSLGYVSLVGVLSLLFLWLPLVLAGVLLGIAPAQWATSVQTLIYAIALVLTTLWVPFSLIAFTLFYYDLRVRNEGFDLELQVAQLEQTTAPPAPGDQVAE